jgi:hypothetical protein
MSGETRQSRKFDLALALAQGHSVIAWSRANQVPKRTAYRWATDAKVRRSVHAIRRRFLDRAVGRMARRATWAVDKIITLGDDAKSESVKLRALRAILSDTMTVSQFATLENRVAKVKEQIHAREQPGNTDRAN